MNYSILKTVASKDYELIDSGEGEKLERFGDIILSRPDPQALWRKKNPESDWKKANGNFVASWDLKKDVPEKWEISHGGSKFWIKPTAFKHVGIFPEQAPNWDWIRENLKERIAKNKNVDVEVLNLFAYTGGATLASAQAGAKVVHIDGSKVAISWARDNAELSGLKDKPIRWILDDVRAFVKREIKRGRKYHGIIMDPPSFGHGADDEVWKIEKDLVELIDMCKEILADEPLFFLVNGYSAGYSAIAYGNNLKFLIEKFGGKIEVGELVIEESGSVSTRNSNEKRLLPCGIFARWTSK